jgi:hypothetical protein
MPDFGIFRGFNEKLFGNKLYAGQLPTQLGKIGSESFGFIGLLDSYPNAVAAYSLRQLRIAYTGSAIRVRRASDNTEQNIGFVNNSLDTSSLTSFCSGTNGFITTWYDQSGNGNNATQTTAANQPQIVSSGSVILQNGKPAVQFDGTNDFLDTSSFIASKTLASIFLVYSIIQNKQNQTIFSRWDNRNFLIRAYNNTGTIDFGVYSSEVASNNIISGNIINLNNTYLSSLIYNGSESFANETSLYNNNVLQTVTRSGSEVNQLQSNSNKVLIGNLGSNSQFLQGTINEIVYYDNSQIGNLSNINNNINTFYSIY